MTQLVRTSSEPRAFAGLDELSIACGTFNTTAALPGLTHPRQPRLARARRIAVFALVLGGCPLEGTASTAESTDGSGASGITTHATSAPTSGGTSGAESAGGTSDGPDVVIPDLGSFEGEPRWVLRDKDGVRVEALVEPRCGSPFKYHEKCYPLDFDSKNSLPCVRVVAHEGRFMNLLYELESGQIEPCNRADANSFGWEKTDLALVPSLVFDNDQCEGGPYGNDLLLSDYGTEFTGVKKTYFIAGEIRYLGEDCSVLPVWVRQEDLTTCKGPYNFGILCPLLTIPPWAMDLLPNPPYTLDVEYGEKP